ncbi:unnamed protein product [Heligmosomoides polygyrus]|uniref:Uncharacterized protein n=1 Tax=Heligmosomoides polygyrus TaxID=6339 RepID=A0A3P8EE03_HELPZ|nr:unnamed protein product [Heligmosomoides polygyrus]
MVVQKGDLRKLFEVTDFYQTVDRDRVFEKLDLAVKVAEKRSSCCRPMKETEMGRVQ